MEWINASYFQRGYTLFEILIVLLIIALAAATAPMAFGSSRASIEAKAAAQSIEDALRAVRAAAINENQRSAIMFDSATGRYRREDAGAWREMSSSLSIENCSPIASGDGAAMIVYYPDGSSSGGEVCISSPKRSWRIRVAMNGRTTTEERKH